MNPDNLSDWNTYIKDALTSLIKDSAADKDSLFIVCTGDLIDKGGKDYNGVSSALEEFKNQIIIPLVYEIGITPDRFIITPGNHDIDRNADDVIGNTGLRGLFSSEANGIKELNDYARSIIDLNDKKYSKRMIPFKNFEHELYKDFTNVKCSFLGTSFQFTCNNKIICFNAINTSWLAFDDKDAEYGVAVSEAQYNRFKEALKCADVKIALMHHPSDWLKYEKNSIGKWLFSDYDIMLVGHVHEADTSITTKLSGTMFTNVAPCFTNSIRSDRKSFANGVTVINYEPTSRHIICKYYIYDLSQRRYILNNDFISDGVWEHFIPNKSGNTLDGVVEHALDYIKNIHYGQINEDMIPQKADVISELKKAYIHMPIVQYGDEEHKKIEFKSILNNNQNQLFFGSGDSGKTILLYRLLMEFVDEFHVHNLIPVYIDFNELGNRDILTLVRGYIDCNSLEAKELAKAKKIILLVDNYNSLEEDSHKRKRLNQFIKEYGIRLIATASNNLPGVLPGNFFENNIIAFEYYFIEQFKTENIKQLMIKWSPGDESLTRNSKIEKMVSSFCSYSLPCTAMSVSLYLWSTENANREPVNQAVLLDIYIEIILEKLSKDNVYHNTFDYKNKTMLLAFLAKDMHDNKKYTYTFGQYINKITMYLETVGFKTFDAERLGNYFIKRKIFTKRCNDVTFAHSCFYYFFLARRMESDKDFYNHVINSDNFYKYDRTIDYFAGLVRKDDHLLDVLYTEFIKYFKPARPIYDEIDVDDFFTNVTAQKEKFVPGIEKIDVHKLAANKPKEETVEKYIQEVSDERLSRITDEISNISYLTPDKFIVIMSRLLRNLDGIESVQLKTEIYSEIIKNAIIFAIIIKNRLAIYANANQGKLPPFYNKVKDVEFFFRFIPYAIQCSIYEFMGTTKLCQVFENKLKDDCRKKRSDVEKFLSLGLLWDTNSLANTKMMKAFITSVGKNSARDYVALKLCYCYLFKVKSGSKEEDEYLSLLSSLKSRQYNLPFFRGKCIAKRLKDIKNEREKNTKR